MGGQSPRFSQQSSPSRRKGAATEVYGFVGWIASFVCFVAYCFWSFLPESALHQFGITYYPDRYWAIAVPVFIMVLGIFIVLVYIASNLMNTAPPQSLDLITDSVAVFDPKPTVVPDDSIPAIADIPIEVVNEVMYRRAR
jgi:phosphatidylinositol glycan class P protein